MTSPRPDIAFDELLTALKNEGFHLTPTDYVEFTAVFNRFTGTREDLRHYLAPILCRNREDQQKFYAIYDRYATPPEQQRRPAPRPTTNPYITPATASYFLRKATRQVYAWFFFLSLIASIVELRLHKHVTVPKITIVVPVNPDTIATAETPPPSNKNKFVVKSLKPHPNKRPEEKSIVVPQGSEIEKETRVHSSAFAWLFVAGLTCLCLSVSFFPLKRSKSLPHVDIDKLNGDHGPLDIPFQPRDHLIQPLPILARIARDLAQPLPTDVYRLEIKKTIRESINAYGLLTPVYENIERRPEYVVIAPDGNPLRTNLYRYLAHTLARHSLPIYFYLSDNYQLRRRHGDAEWISFDALEIPEPLLSQFDFGPTLHGVGVEAIRRWLDDEDIFQWLCALAVFPTVRWEVTLAVGAAVLKERKALHKLNFISLLKFSRIGWLNTNTGGIPGDIRLELLQQLGVNEELVTRGRILDLLRESDDIILAGTEAFEQKMMQIYTQSFILFAHDTRRNKTHEADARQFMSAFNRRQAPDLATVLYLSNPDNQWATPVRSAEDPARAANADRFINELLARKVIADPRIRALFRNLSAGFFFVLLLLYLFKDNIEPTGFNASLGLLNRDYPTGAVTVNIPVSACLRQMVKGHYLLVTLNNYDNNRYSQLLDLDGKDTLRASFSGITMTGKDTSQAAFGLILNKTLAVECPSKQYYSNYTVLLKGDDCGARLPEIKPNADRRPLPNTLQQ
jgi:hypothetical protein